MQHQLRRARVRQRAQHHDWADKAQVAKDEKAAAGRESGGASIAVAAASWSVASKQPKKKMVDMSPRRQRQEQAQQQQPQQQQQQAEDEGAAVVQVTVEFQTADVRAAGPPQAINAFSLRALNVHGALRALPHREEEATLVNHNLGRSHAGPAEMNSNTRPKTRVQSERRGGGVAHRPCTD